MGQESEEGTHGFDGRQRMDSNLLLNNLLQEQQQTITIITKKHYLYQALPLRDRLQVAEMTQNTSGHVAGHVQARYRKATAPQSTWSTGFAQERII